MIENIKCGRAYQNCYGDQEASDSFREHVKTCKDCDELINYMANKAFEETIHKLFGV